MFVKDWYNTMVNICYLCCSYLNINFRNTYICSNDTILRIVSKQLDDDINLELCAACDFYPSVWKHIYYFLYEGSVIFPKWLFFHTRVVIWTVTILTLSPVLFPLRKFVALLGSFLWGINDCKFISLLKLVSNNYPFLNLNMYWCF